MDTNEQIILKLEARKKELARDIAQQIKNRQVEPFSNFPVPQLEQAIMPSVDMVFSFFRTSDAAALKAEIEQRASVQVKQGYPASSLQLGIELIVNAIEQEIDKITAGDANSAVIRPKYKNRLESIKTLSKISVINYDLKENL